MLLLLFTKYLLTYCYVCRWSLVEPSYTKRSMLCGPRQCLVININGAPNADSGVSLNLFRMTRYLTLKILLSRSRDIKYYGLRRRV